MENGSQPKYDAVIFDLFGTLVEIFTPRTYDGLLADLSTVLGVSIEEFSRVWNKETWPMRSRGEFATLEETFEYVCQCLGVAASREQLQQASKIRFAYTQASLIPRDDAISTLSTLKATGHKLGLISDCTLEVPKLWHSTALASLIEQPIFSCDVRMKKPDARIYQLACERLQVAPERCLYVGDGGSNELTGAEAVGMQPVLIRAAVEGEHDGKYRYDEDTWSKTRISSLREVLELV